MLRYRIIGDHAGKHFVISALAWLVPIEETYATRTAAQETADWLNYLACDAADQYSAMVSLRR